MSDENLSTNGNLGMQKQGNSLKRKTTFHNLNPSVSLSNSMEDTNKQLFQFKRDLESPDNSLLVGFPIEDEVEQPLSPLLVTKQSMLQIDVSEDELSQCVNMAVHPCDDNFLIVVGGSNGQSLKLIDLEQGRARELH